MPISYSVTSNGHFVHAVAEGRITRQEFVEYEVAHAMDERISAPVSELLEISAGSLTDITMDDMREVLKRRGEVDRLPWPHRCAIVLRSLDDHTWSLAKFYEGMVMLHAPETVIVFASHQIASLWLGFEVPEQSEPVRPSSTR